MMEKILNETFTVFFNFDLFYISVPQNISDEKPKKLYPLETRLNLILPVIK